MSKYLLSLLLLLPAWLPALGAERSEGAARLIAARVAAGWGARVAMSAPTVSSKGLAAARSAFYVFNLAGDSGYVLVAADDRLPDVVGYSTRGAFASSGPNPSLSFLLAAYQRTVAAVQGGDAATTARVARLKALRATSSEPVAPLLTTTWNQYAPYNALCPAISGGSSLLGGRASAGCVPTALGQILYYHRWPAALGADIPAYVTATQGLSVAGAARGTAYAWDQMKTSYPADATSAEVAPCATLLFDLGRSLRADYNDGGNGETAADGDCYPLIHYFNYDADLLAKVRRSHFLLDDWCALINGELRAARPVFYEALGRYEEDGELLTEGHAFVLDGLNAAGQYHVNWGWGGADDGYFDIEAMMGDGITWNLEADCMVGLVPANNHADAPLVSRLSLYHRPSATGHHSWCGVDGERAAAHEPFTGRISYCWYNADSLAFRGYVALAVRGADGSFSLISTPRFDSVASGEYLERDTLAFSYAFPQGTTLVYGVVSYDGQTWLPALDNDKFAYEFCATPTTLQVANLNLDGAIAITNPDAVQMADGQPLFSLTVGRSYNYTLTLRNTAATKAISERTLHLYCYEQSTRRTVSLRRSFTVSLAAGDSLVLPFTFTPTTAGRQYLYAYDFDTGTRLLQPWALVQTVSAVERTAQPSVRAIGGRGALTLQGFGGRRVCIYDVSGRLVATRFVAADVATIALPAGLYVVAGCKVRVR